VVRVTVFRFWDPLPLLGIDKARHFKYRYIPCKYYTTDDTTSIVDDYQHYIDIDRVHADNGGGDQLTTGPGSADQVVRSRGYEGLDPSVLATLRQPPRPHDYADLGAGEGAASTQQTAEQIEMTEFNAGVDHQDTVR